MMSISSLATKNIRNKDQLLHRLTSSKGLGLYQFMTPKTGKLNHFDA
jgi:hypothetical protein